MELERSSGMLLHITSLPSKYGTGDFGPEAFKFIDFLFKTKQKLWQTGLRVGSHGTTKIVPWDKNFLNCPMGWDDKFLKGIPSHGMGSKNFSSHGMGRFSKISRPIPSHPMKLHTNVHFKLKQGWLFFL